MSVEWRDLARKCDMSAIDDKLDIVLRGGRHQIIRIDESGGRIRIWTIIAKPSMVDKRIRQQAWIRNKLSEFVGFRTDQRGRLIGETHIPNNASVDEWLFLVNNLAATCDHYEYLLTGRDSE